MIHKVGHCDTISPFQHKFNQRSSPAQRLLTQAHKQYNLQSPKFLVGRVCFRRRKHNFQNFSFVK